MRRRKPAETHTAEETKVTRLQRGYLPILRFGLRHPFITLGIALLVFVATLGSATFLKTDFLGSVTDQTTLAIHQKLPPGTRLSTTSAAAEQVENILQADPQVKNYLVTIGGSLVPGATPSTNTAEFTVLLVDGAKADTVRPQLQQQMAELDESAGEITVTTTNNQSTTQRPDGHGLRARTPQACRPAPSESSRSWRPFRASPTSAATSRSSARCSR